MVRLSFSKANELITIGCISDCWLYVGKTLLDYWILHYVAFGVSVYSLYLTKTVKIYFIEESNEKMFLKNCMVFEMINNIKFNVWIKLAKISVDRFFEIFTVIVWE